MKHHIILKFIAVFLCAASLMGAVGSGLGLFAVSELGLNYRTLEEAYEESTQYTAQSLAHELAVRYASRELGGASEAMLDDYYGYYWLDTNFDWEKIGYTILDAEGNALEGQELGESNGSVTFYDLTVDDGRYINILNVMTGEEYEAAHHPATEPPVTEAPDSELTAYNAVPEEGSEISYLHISYLDGSAEEYGNSSQGLGLLSYYHGQDQLMFDFRDLSAGEMVLANFRGSSPVSMTFFNTHGELVLEISHPDCVLAGFSETSGSASFILMPMEDAAQLPQGSIYDAIPPEGQSVTRCTVVYADGWEESAGGAPDIGYLGYDSYGYVYFTAGYPDILEHRTEVVTYISFHDEYDNLVYEAYDADGIGVFSLEEGGILTFRSSDVTGDPQEPSASDGDIYVYDDVPPRGYEVNYIELWLKGASNGILIEAEQEPLGIVTHDGSGNVLFTARDWRDFVFSKPAEVVHILMTDADGRTLYEAKEADVPTGSGCTIGVFAYNESGDLVFCRSSDAVTAASAENTEEDLPAASPKELPGESIPTGVPVELLADTPLHAAPSEESTVLDVLLAGTVVEFLQTDHFGTELLWGQLDPGWILVVPEELAILEDSDTIPAVTEAENAEGTAPTEEYTVPAMTEESASETVPVMTDETPLSTAPTLAGDTADVTVPQSTDPYEIALAEDTLRVFGYYDHSVGESMYVEYTYEDMPAYTVQIHMAQGALAHQYEWVLMDMVYSLKDYLVFILVGSLLLFAITAVYLCCSAGRRPGSTEIRAGGLNCISLDLYLAAAIGGVMLCIVAGVEGGDYLLRNDINTGILFVVLLSFAASLLIVGFCFAFAAQVKTPGGYWWRNSLCGRSLKLIAWLWNKFIHLCGWLWDKYDQKFEPLLARLFKALWKLVKFFFQLLKKTVVRLVGALERGTDWLGRKLTRFFSLLPLTWQWLLVGFVLVLWLFIAVNGRYEGLLLMWAFAALATVLYAAHAFGTLLESAKRMSKGDLDEKVDDKLLIGGFRDFADELNGLADVAVVAAQKQLKSERMKTELITNVSHDIKTPLTSIINYVDLMEKPHTPEEQQAYLEVLSRQSLRLKKLIDDLMEMSKASTGNMAVDITEVNAAEAVNQALGEFADKLDRAQLIPVFRQPEADIHMMADGRLVWRVLSNLLSNAVKYAMPGTRLYIDLIELEGKVVLSLKNISRDSLNINADELLERFVRGDTARNTEGSGLGLNIAQSLMELQRGKLELLVDGDLFKVTLVFPGA